MGYLKDKYSVTVWSGNEGKKVFCDATEEQIMSAVELFERCPGEYNLLFLHIRSPCVELNDQTKNTVEQGGWLRLTANSKLETLIDIHVIDPKWANLCAEKLKLPIPFPNIEY